MINEEQAGRIISEVFQEQVSLPEGNLKIEVKSIAPSGVATIGAWIFDEQGQIRGGCEQDVNISSGIDDVDRYRAFVEGARVAAADLYLPDMEQVLPVDLFVVELLDSDIDSDAQAFADALRDPNLLVSCLAQSWLVNFEKKHHLQPIDRDLGNLVFQLQYQEPNEEAAQGLVRKNAIEVVPHLLSVLKEWYDIARSGQLELKESGVDCPLEDIGPWVSVAQIVEPLLQKSDNEELRTKYIHLRNSGLFGNS